MHCTTGTVSLIGLGEQVAGIARRSSSSSSSCQMKHCRVMLNGYSTAAL